MGKLYLVGTPIGNLGDVSPRAAEVLEAVDFIAAEDTRVSMKLMNHLGLKKPMVSYFRHNFEERGPQILQRIQSGESCAVITDAGMPCISDPGEDLVRLCHEQNIEMEVVPGPSALIAALAVSGLATGRFAFEGFLSVNASSRREHLESIRREERTLIFYEAPHKLLSTLKDMGECFGMERRLTVCRELTKLHEEHWRTTFGEAVRRYTETPPRGEFVLVVEGASPEENQPEPVSLEQAAEMVLQLNGCGVSLSDAAKQVAADSGYKKGELYRLALNLQGR